MGLIQLTRRWPFQPHDPQPLNRAHPILRGLVALWVPKHTARNIVGNSELFIPTAWTASPGGAGGRFAGEVSAESALLTANWGFATAFVSGTGASISCVVGRGPSSPNNTGFGFHGTHTNATYAGAIYCGSSYSVVGKPTGGALVNGQRYVIGAGVTGSAGAVYSNGVRTASATGLSAVNTTGRLALGLTSALAEGWTLAPSFEYYAQWDRQPSDAEFAEVYEMPWDTFFVSRRYWAFATAGGAASAIPMLHGLTRSNLVSGRLVA